MWVTLISFKAHCEALLKDFSIFYDFLYWCDGEPLCCWIHSLHSEQVPALPVRPLGVSVVTTGRQQESDKRWSGTKLLYLSVISLRAHFWYISVWLYFPLLLIQLFSFISLKLFSFCHFAVEACQICRSCCDDRFPVLQGRPFSWWFVLIPFIGVLLLEPHGTIWGKENGLNGSYGRKWWKAIGA